MKSAGLYPGRNIRLRKFEEACRPEAALPLEGEPWPDIRVFGELRAEYDRFRACLNDYSGQLRAKED